MNKKARSSSVQRLSSHLKDIFRPAKAPSMRLESLRKAVISGGELIANKKHVVTIGGGTGTFVVLSALKDIPDVLLSAVVSVADDGGSTGRLRDAYGFLPLGDARQALVALAKKDTMLRDLFTYRFSKGDIAGHNLGNLLLTALTDRLGSDGAAIRAASDILRVRGQVEPVSEYPATLVVELENGKKVVGQHAINARPPGGPSVVALGIEETVTLSKGAKKAVESADMIVLGPGDLYTSTLANFAVPGLREAVMASHAKIVYFVNLFTTASETDGYTASKHVAEIARYAGRKPDYVIMHSGVIPPGILEYYAKKMAFPMVDDLGESAGVIRGTFADVVPLPKIEGDAIERSLIRHNPEAVADVIQSLL